MLVRPLFHALIHGHVETVKVFLDTSDLGQSEVDCPVVNKPLNSNVTETLPIFFAAKYKHVELTRYLEKMGAKRFQFNCSLREEDEVFWRNVDDENYGKHVDKIDGQTQKVEDLETAISVVRNKLSLISGAEKQLQKALIVNRAIHDLETKFDAFKSY